MNKVILIGRIGQNCEPKDVNGQTLASFSLATSERYTDKNGNKQEITDWHNCSMWGIRAEKLAPYLTKGKLVAVTGSIHYREAEKDGVKTRYTDIRVDDLEFLSSGESKPQPAPQPQPQKPAQTGDLFINPPQVDDLPF